MTEQEFKQFLQHGVRKPTFTESLFTLVLALAIFVGQYTAVGYLIHIGWNWVR